MSFYDPLPSTASTRLVCLQPSPDFKAPVEVSHLTIEVAAAGPSWPYEAVSYTWGDEGDSLPIRLNGQAVSIRRNLHQGLLRLRHHSAVRYLWVDALSISQNDLKEKAAQVQMIGDIFSSAERVLIWLGEHAGGSEELFRGWERFGNLDTDRIMNPVSDIDAHEILRRARLWNTFLSLHYWRRTWIVQEIALARAIVIHCGPDSADWANMVGTRLLDGSNESHNDYVDGIPMRTVTTPSDSADNLSSSFHVDEEEKEDMEYANCLFELAELVHHVFVLHSYWLSVRSKEKRNILNILLNLDDMQCENKLDQIYALLSLEGHLSNAYPVIEVDYTLSLPELLINVFAKRYVYFEKRRKLDAQSEQSQVEYLSSIINKFVISSGQRDEMAELLSARYLGGRPTHQDFSRQRWTMVHAALQESIKEFGDDMNRRTESAA